MNRNSEAVQEATLLFVEQIKQRPENVVANLNALLEGEGFRLELVDTRPVCQNPAEASLFDWQRPPREQYCREELEP